MKESAATAPDLVYVVEKFPSETLSFVYNEIRVLDELGLRVEIHSLLPGEVCPNDARVFAGRTRTLGPVRLHSMLGAIAFYLVRRPGTLARLLATLPFDAEGDRLRKAARIVHQVLVGAVFARTLWGRHCHVHAHFAFKAATAALVAAELNSRTFSFTSHGSDTVIPSRRFCLRHKVARARLVVAVSEYNRGVLRSVCPEANPDSIIVNRTGVLPEQFAMRETAPADDGVLSIVCVANLYPVKNHDGLLRACGELARRGVRFKLTLAGRDAAGLEAGLRDLARSEGIEPHVEFLGMVDHDRVATLLADADACVLASHSEGIPVALMEAMARGVPVVGPRVTGVPELVIDDVTGLLVDSSLPAEIADALERLAREPELGPRLARKARAHIEAEFDMRVNARRLGSILGELLRTPK